MLKIRWFTYKRILRGSTTIRLHVFFTRWKIFWDNEANYTEELTWYGAAGTPAASTVMYAGSGFSTSYSSTCMTAPWRTFSSSSVNPRVATFMYSPVKCRNLRLVQTSRNLITVNDSLKTKSGFTKPFPASCTRPGSTGNKSNRGLADWRGLAHEAEAPPTASLPLICALR